MMDATYDGRTLRLYGRGFFVDPEEAEEIVKAIYKYGEGVRRFREEKQTEAGHIWSYWFFRYGSREERTAFSLEEAVDFLHDGQEGEYLFAYDSMIACPDGTKLSYEDAFKKVYPERILL